ncbi:MAG: hypothetical protein JWP35_3597 [Caulobacter sp.]|nr:hypothetical protein [Caulobacter sp.]
MKRWVVGALSAGLVLTAVVACAVVQTATGLHGGRTAAGPSITLNAKPVALNDKDPKQDRSGDFLYAGGVDVTSSDTGLLHGLSDLVITADGRLVSESDEGRLFRAQLVLDGAGRLVGLSHGTLTPLTGLDGKPLSSKEESDAEGVAVWPNGDVMVSFERDHRIWRYPAAGGPPVAMPIPVDPKMTGNEGMEGLALAPSQGPDAYWVGVENGDIFLCRVAKACERKASLPRPPDTYRLASMTETPDGQLVILHDSWAALTGARCRVSIIAQPGSDHPAVIDTLVLAPPMTTDNFEGVAAVMRPGGVLRLYLIVDDNFQATERTLLMAFDRPPSPAGAAL